MTKNKRRRKSKRRKNSFEHKPLPKISAQKGKTLKGQFKKLMSGDRGKTPVSRRISGKASYRFYRETRQWLGEFKNNYKLIAVMLFFMLILAFYGYQNYFQRNFNSLNLLQSDIINSSEISNFWKHEILGYPTKEELESNPKT